MKILIDMNLSPRWVDFLSGNGIEAMKKAQWFGLDPA
jgi:predicted nuclease of predicted toxin-antitoxin system